MRGTLGGGVAREQEAQMKGILRRSVRGRSCEGTTMGVEGLTRRRSNERTGGGKERSTQGKCRG